MAKRRKSRKLGGLAGSPSHHLAQAEGNYEEAETDYIKAGNFLAIDKCGRAYKALFDAVAYHEAALTHEEESEGHVRDSLKKRVIFAKKRVSGTFVKKCLVGGGKLSGMHRAKKLSGLGAGMSASGTSKGKNIKLVVKKQDDEWQVRVYENGKFKEGPTYYAGDKQDAVDTFKSMKAQYGLAGMRRRKAGR